MRHMFLFLLALSGIAGCNSTQLRFTTLRLTSTLPDLQEKQVLDNFARLALNPGSLPFFAVVDAGTANIDDSGNGSLSFGGSPRAFTTGTYGLGASRTVTGNWSLKPLNNPDRLAAMRAAYTMVLQPDAVDPRDLAKLRAALGTDPSYAISGGWLCVGEKRDVAKDACVVAQNCGTYVWVLPQNIKAFSDFVLTILNIASVTAPADGQAQAPAALLPPAISPTGTVPSFAPRLYEDSPGINRGLFFIPRR